MITITGTEGGSGKYLVTGMPVDTQLITPRYPKPQTEQAKRSTWPAYHG